MATTLHLIRHSEASDHEAVDPGLSPLGVRQAHAVAMRLAGVEAEQILHSPKRRAIETAQIVGEHLEIPTFASTLVDDRTPIPDDRSGVPQRYHAFLDRVPRAERDLGGRHLDAAVDMLGTGDGADRRLIVVTHNFVIGWFVRRALDAPSWRWLELNQANAALTTIIYSPDCARLVTFNDVGHLLPLTLA